jgi:hypothetical protein
MARREAGPRERWPKMLQRELENNSRKPRDLVKNRRADSLKKWSNFFLGIKKKEYDVADDKDEVDVITRVSLDRVTATLCTEKLFLRTQYI